MAGTMIHLLVAEKLLAKLMKINWGYANDKNISFDRDMFIAGNVCPDGIMTREGYVREMKLHTHFRDNIPDGSFDKPGMVDLFEKRMRDFWKANWREEYTNHGLYLGYITHMMVDKDFILYERPNFFKNIAVTGLTVNDIETFICFNRETDLVDFRLISEYSELLEAKKSLENVHPYEIKGMISTEELTKSRKWILEHFFYSDHDGEKSKYLIYEDMVDFINRMVNVIYNRLFEENYLSEM